MLCFFTNHIYSPLASFLLASPVLGEVGMAGVTKGMSGLRKKKLANKDDIRGQYM
jgi:hypothetical protein